PDQEDGQGDAGEEGLGQPVLRPQLAPDPRVVVEPAGAEPVVDGLRPVPVPQLDLGDRGWPQDFGPEAPARLRSALHPAEVRRRARRPRLLEQAPLVRRRRYNRFRAGPQPRGPVPRRWRTSADRLLDRAEQPRPRRDDPAED